MLYLNSTTWYYKSSLIWLFKFPFVLGLLSQPPNHPKHPYTPYVSLGLTVYKLMLVQLPQFINKKIEILRV